VTGWPPWLLVLVFLVAGAAIWVAGIQLSDQTDVLSSRLGIGSAFGGLILLAIATNLPEIAIVVSAALSGDVGLAVRDARRWPTDTVAADGRCSSV
jgi:cation:H+ antiporter